MIRQAAERFLTVVREKGLASAFKRVVYVVRGAFGQRPSDEFDSALRTDTSTAVSLWRLKIPSENAKFGGKYQTTSPDVFEEAVKLVPVDPAHVVFVDLGCGKGRTLILAERLHFKRIIGVEFSPELCTIARKNLSSVGASAEVVEADASQYEFPDAELLIYMYNPFSEPVLRSVCDNLIRWRRRYSKTGYIAYLNPLYSACLDRRSDFEPVSRTDEARVWRIS